MLTRLYKSFRFCAERALGLRRDIKAHVISRDPLVLVTTTAPGLDRLLQLLNGPKKCHLFLLCYWSFHAPDQIQEAQQTVRLAKESGAFEATFLANSEDEASLARAADIPCIVCNHNAFLDENVFAIDPAAEKKHRAIYDARITDFKRHELAAEVRELAIITYKSGFNESDDLYNRIRELLRSAKWLNELPDGSTRPLNAREVAAALNQSRVGLILSRLEGGNYASAQYLLCGLSVVSTPSMGGRDAFFAEPHVAIAEPNPTSVAAAVERLINLNLDPHRVRAETLNLMQIHRQRFIAAVQKIYDDAKVPRRFADEWPSVFVNKLIGDVSPREIKTLVHGD